MIGVTVQGKNIIAENVAQQVRKALNAFFENDFELLSVEANERSISHKLAEHLQVEFSKHKVDCEYNRHGEDVKRLQCFAIESTEANDLEARTVYPDIIVHKRRTDEENLLVIEIKKHRRSTRSGIKKDIEKLKCFTGVNFKYDHGLLLVFDVDEKRVHDVKHFSSGREDCETIWEELKELGYSVQ